MLRYRDCKTNEEKLNFVKQILEEDFGAAIGGDETDVGYQTAIVMLAAMAEGTDVKRLSRLTNYPESFIESIAWNARRAELWSREGPHYDHWFDGDLVRSEAFCCDVLVAQGLFRRKRNDEGEWLYRAVKES
jgi:hypothetical protein